MSVSCCLLVICILFVFYIREAGIKVKVSSFAV